jgi:NAD(P)-dependent dehydrogenase (short-subunit alcohol dehydrogenase family)
MARRGFSVAINYAGNEQAAAETAGLCEQLRLNPGQRFVPIRADVGEPADRTALLDRTLGSLGRIDALVNNAGVGPRVRADLTQTSLGSFREVLQVNLEGPFFLTQLLANRWLSGTVRPLLPHGFTVVFVSSVSADTASVNRGEYCVSKAGLAMVSQLWAVRLAQENIHVYELRPGIMATDMTSAVKEKYDTMIDQGLVPQRRWGTDEDTGRAAAALVAGEFPYSTGSVIHVDGGLHLRRL